MLSQHLTWTVDAMKMSKDIGVDQGDRGRDCDLHPLVLELVLEHVDRETLSECRLVSHAWNAVATRLINKSGRRMQLNGSKPRAYLKLLRASSKFRSVRSQSQLAAPIMTTQVWCSYSSLNTANKISSYAGTYSGFTVLDCVIDRKGFEPSFLALIRSSAVTLREIRFKVYTRMPRPVRDNLKLSWNNLREKLSSWRLRPRNYAISSLEYGSLKLPAALKTLGIFYEPEGYEFPPTAIPGIILQVAMGATNLESIKVHGTSSSAVIVNTLSELHKLDNASHSRIIDNLTELSLRLTWPEHTQIIDHVHFNRLRTLNLSCRDFNVAKAPFLPKFLRESCRGLQSLQIYHPLFVSARDVILDYANDDESTSTNADVKHVTHFGFYFNWNSQFYNSRVSHAAPILGYMQCLPNLTRVSLNLASCAGLASHVFKAGVQNPVDKQLRRTKWPHVKTLTSFKLTAYAAKAKHMQMSTNAF